MGSATVAHVLLFVVRLSISSDLCVVCSDLVSGGSEYDVSSDLLIVKEGSRKRKKKEAAQKSILFP